MSVKYDDVASFSTQVMNDVINLDVGDSVDPDAPVGPDGIGVESITMMELVVHLEREYNITLTDDEVDSMLASTFAEMVEHIVGRCNA